ncbi:nucleotide sugar dehydrogenase [Stratiformator vulcanicus]|uniref:UDP-N-acetyl-D-glucosamine 6-dehydrogenase n=1 Tax=Stratiformator vulcanicus TaxID=2527980 RepID=A0A517R5C1_9PLAN|nr:nucleotide sugar dehydrogenase [Stratiformator vulcanicus]QDT39088.1 UDP-N-acetyl-D-glucosamine 6-dehydrogenase [Stratiformator vulcanicus]
MLNSFLETVKVKSARVGVIGLGYVGLPLSRAFIDGGLKVIGFDVDRVKIDKLLAGTSYIRGLPDEQLNEWRHHDCFEPTDDMTRLSEPDALLICVPTPLDEDRSPDLKYVISTAEQIAKALRPGQLVVLESTTYPTTTRDIVLPILERSGLTVGEDFFLAYSPEREDPGNPSHTASVIPKVVGGIDEGSLRAAVALYENAVVSVVPVSSPEIAEASKILENTYRAVNIALVNDLKMLFDRMGIDVWEVIEAAKTKPFGFQAFYPGPGLGGHCIPIDPFYLSWLARKQNMTTRFIELAGEVNSRMPDYVIRRLMIFLNETGKAVRGSKICVLGLAYKKDVDDPRESPSFELIEKLQELGAEVSYSDPYIPVAPTMRKHAIAGLESRELTPDFLKSLDAVLIATDHTDFDYDLIAEHSSLVIDTRNAMKKAEARNNIRKA